MGRIDAGDDGHTVEYFVFVDLPGHRNACRELQQLV